MSDIPQHEAYLLEFEEKIQQLNWTLDEKPELLPARAHILLKFTVNDHKYLYRRAKFSPQQIYRQILARKILGDTVSIEHYSDKYCIIQDYVDGEAITPNPDCSAWETLGKILSKVHSIPCFGFGPLKSSSAGSYSSHYSFIYSDLPCLKIIHNAQVLSFSEIKKLEEYLLNPPQSASPHTVVCHSDVWPPNLIFNPKNQNLRLIDWEQISSNYPEYDFLGFANITHPNSAEIYNKILSGYQHPLNPDLIDYFILLSNVSRFNNINSPNIKSLSSKIQSLKPLFLKG